MNSTLNPPLEGKAVHQPLKENEPNKLDIVEQSIIDTIYSQYGKPSNIIEEKLRLYTSYSSPAGWVVKGWDDGGWQRGRLTVFVEYEENSYTKTKIDGSWFFHTDGTVLKIFSGNEVEATLEIVRKPHA